MKIISQLGIGARNIATATAEGKKKEDRNKVALQCAQLNLSTVISRL